MNLTTLVEIARVALQEDHEYMAGFLDLSDVEIRYIKDELEDFVNGNGSLNLTVDLQDGADRDDAYHTTKTIPTNICFGNDSQITIQPKGYADMYGGEPILIEHYEDDIHIRVWNNPDEEDPSVCVKLARAVPPIVEWDVPVCRIGIGHNTIRVQAATEEEAIRLADDEAGTHEYSDNHVEYEINDGATKVE